jgi:hypothetical protein
MHPTLLRLWNYVRLGFFLGCVALQYVSERICRLIPTGISSLELDSSQRFGRLKYRFKGEIHTMMVPYNVRLAPKMRETTVSMVVNGQEIDVTQPPGVVYLYSAQQIGGTESILRMGEEITTLGLTVIPLN